MDIEGVWRVNKIELREPQTFLREQMKHIVFSESRETWEVYSWPVKFDDDPGGPRSYRIDESGRVVRTYRGISSIADCRLEGDELFLSWDDGADYFLVRETSPETVARLSVCPPHAKRVYCAFDGLGELARFGNSWAGSVVLQERSVDISVFDDDTMDREGLFARAMTVITKLKDGTLHSILQSLSQHFLEDWIHCCQDGAPEGAPSPALLLDLLIVDEVCFDDGVAISVRVENDGRLQREWDEMSSAMGWDLTLDWQLTVVMTPDGLRSLIQ